MTSNDALLLVLTLFFLHIFADFFLYHFIACAPQCERVCECVPLIC